MCLNNLLFDHVRLWMLTGTPAAQSPEDAFGLAKLVCPERVPKFKTGWKDQVMVQLSRFVWVPRSNAVDLVYRSLQPAIRFTKDQCLDLPEITYTTRVVPLSRQQETFYEKIKSQMLIHAADETITAVNAATLMNKLLQLSMGVMYSDTGDVVSFDAKNRLSVLLEAIRESTNKVLVFVPFKHAIQSVSEFLTQNGITNDIISGAVSATRRGEIFRDFQQETDPRVLVIQPQAAAHGVTLTAADTVIWFGPTTSLESYLQANARVHRKGQRHNVTIIHLQGSSVEAKVYSTLRKKEDIHAKVVELFYQEVDKVNSTIQTGAENE